MPSTSTTALFVSLVALIGVVLVLALRAAYPGTRWATAAGAAFVSAWLTLTAALGASGVFLDFEGTPPLFMRFMALNGIAAVALVLSPLGGRIARAQPLAALVGMQAFRLPLELLLHRLHVEGALPEQMTYLGRNLDILTGILAVPVALVVLRRGESDALARRLALAFNLVGLGLLVNIVSVSVLSMPGPLRVFMSEPAPVVVLAAPYIWLPTVLVMGALLGHLLTFRHLLRQEL